MNQRRSASSRRRRIFKVDAALLAARGKSFNGSGTINLKARRHLNAVWTLPSPWVHWQPKADRLRGYRTRSASHCGRCSVVLFFAVTLFVSSFLLFVVQPMVGKMILPTMGGTPNVWNTCMVFFQAVLLLGYAYAHGAVRLFGVRRQPLFHLPLLLCPLIVLPITVGGASAQPSMEHPTPWLLAQLLLGVGLPFFLVSTTAPLLQMWFSRTGHHSATDPYFLYSASNVGSLLALLGYPFFVERFFRLSEQSLGWMYVYWLLIVLIIGCALVMWFARKGVTRPVVTENPGDEPVAGPNGRAHIRVTVGLRLWWIFLAFVPSSMMLGVTTYITTNIAPVPLLWVLPLALYLLTFVLVFARKQIIPHTLMINLLPFLVAPLALATVQLARLWWIPVHLLMFFVAAMVCHGELVRRRPATSHLTEFYLWMSVGGVLGGLFNAVVAPAIFVDIWEYPLVMILSCLAMVRLTREGKTWRRIADLAIPVAVGAATICLIIGISKLFDNIWLTGAHTLKILIPAALCLVFINRRLRFTLCVTCAVVASVYVGGIGIEKSLHQSRNFFGVKRVDVNKTRTAHFFKHGTTTHGVQGVHPRFDEMPTGYYHETGPIGDVFRVFRYKNENQNVAIVGLGIGGLALYAKPWQHFVFFEIDPEVIAIAENPEYFTCLKKCKGTYEIILGDGRLELAKMDRKFGMIILDAFNSDAVPTHLLSTEAIRMYLEKLDEEGLLVFNISNQYLNLSPLMGALADDVGLVCYRRLDTDTSRALEGKYPSQFAIMARSKADLGRIIRDRNWERLDQKPTVRPWTDQYSNLLSVWLDKKTR
jgi:spermidine synthase